jgi:multiple sugar transport system substrate-binding protein
VRLPLLVALLAAALAGAGLVPAAARADNLTLACLDIGRVVEACRAAAARFGEMTGHEVRVVAANPAGRDALERYGALFGVASGRLDVIDFPEAWVPALATHLAALDQPAEAPRFIPQLLASGRSGGRLVGLPHHLAITLLFVRSDVVAADETMAWGDVREALLMGPADGVSGLSLGGAGPTMFPFILDWLYSYGATALDDRGVLIPALQAMNGTLGAVGSPTVAATTPAEALTDFTSGNSAALVAPSTALPAVSGSTLADAISTLARPSAAGLSQTPAVLASVWYVGVSRHSANPGPAADLAAFLVAEETQRLAALEFGLAPTLTTLYADSEILAASPVFGKIAEAIPSMRLPPVSRYGLAYLDLADEVSEAVRAMLRGDTEPDAAAAAITRAARRASRQVD